MAKPSNPRLRKALLEIVENQMRDGTPPQTRETLERLMAAGLTRDRAVKMIACVVTSEIFDVLKQGKPYDEGRFVAGLRALPRVPWEKEA
jgi:peroxiredoxin family protein